MDEWSLVMLSDHTEAKQLIRSASSEIDDQNDFLLEDSIY